MAPNDRELLTDVLRACFEAAPNPLYPAQYAGARGLDRGVLDRALDELRLKGLVRLTEWVQGLGQGYTLTPGGVSVLENPHGIRPGAPLPTVRPPVEPAEEPEQIDRLRALLSPSKPRVTWAIITVNVLIFVLDDAHLLKGVLGDRFTLATLGTLWAPAVLQGHQWWRVVTYAFLHAGILHIGLNMYFLYSVGPYLERMWGPVRFLLLYFVSAITGGCMVLWVGRGMPTVGASGALCGILASLGIWAMLNRDNLPPALAQGLIRTTVINLALIAIMSFSLENISWEGHLGGAIGGALASFPLQLSRYGGTWPRRILGILGTLMVAVVFVAITVSRNWVHTPPL